MSSQDPAHIGAAGVAVANLVITTQLGWIFREQAVQDHGIDAHVESKSDGHATGRLLALQIKASQERFSDSSKGGWYFRVSEQHARYWLGHSLPVVIVLVDVSTQQAYWALVDSDSLESTRKAFKIWVPSSQRLESARPVWAEILEGTSRRLLNEFEQFTELLPPTSAASLRMLHRDSPLLAAQIASLLSSGRFIPSLTAESVIHRYSNWLDGGGFHAWTAVGYFAEEHDELERASIAFEAAAKYSRDRAGRMLALAAATANASDGSRARALLSRARELEGDSVVVAVVSAAIDPDLVDINSPRFQQSLLDRITFADQDPTALFFLAGRASFDRQESEAIRLLLDGLRLRPETSDAMTMLAECYSRRAQSPASVHDDLTHAVEWAERSVDQRRRWAGNTHHALAVLLRSLAMQSRFSEALTIGTPPPYGSATASESSDLAIARLLMRIASDAGRADLADAILLAVSDEASRSRLQLETQDTAGWTRGERARLYAELLDSTDHEDSDSIVHWVLQLASVGVDQAERLERLASDGIYPKYYPDLARAIAHSANDPASNLDELRVLAEEDSTAAEVLIMGLRRLERYADAARAAHIAWSRFGMADFVALEVQMLDLAGQSDEAERLILSAVSDGRVTGTIRTGFVISAGIRRAQANDLETAVSLFERAAPESVSAAWNLVACHERLGHFHAARATLDAFDLTPSDENEIALWLELVVLTGWTKKLAEIAIAKAVDLASVNAELASSLLAAVVYYTRGVGEPDEHAPSVDARPRVPGEIHARAFELLDELVARDSENALAVRRIHIDEGNVLETATALTRPADQFALRNLMRGVTWGIIPLGILSIVLHRPYSLVLASGGVGVTVASLPDGDWHERENERAGACTPEHDVVADLSAVSLAIRLGALDALKARFRHVFVSLSSRVDAARSVVEARGMTAASGTLGWDWYAERPVMSEVDSESQLRTLAAAEHIDRAVERLAVRRVEGERIHLKGLDESAREHAFVEAIELAAQLGCALWSDDVGQRRLADDLGVPSFGTVNLLETDRLARLTGHHEDLSSVSVVAEEQAEFIRELVRMGIVDQPVLVTELERMLRDHDSLAGVTKVLTRPAWWGEQGSIDSWFTIRLAAIEAGDLGAAWGVLAATLEGVASVTAEDRAHSARLLATIAVSGVTPVPTVVDAVRGLNLAARVAASLSLNSPRSEVAAACAQLGRMGMLNDPEAFAVEVLEAFDQQRAEAG